MFYNPGTKVIDEKGTFKLPPQKKIKIKKPEDKFKGKLRITNVLVLFEQKLIIFAEVKVFLLIVILKQKMIFILFRSIYPTIWFPSPLFLYYPSPPPTTRRRFIALFCELPLSPTVLFIVIISCGTAPLQLQVAH
jgi:hypothetical protein